MPPIWLCVLTALIVLNVILDLILLKPDAVASPKRTPPPPEIQKGIIKLTRMLSIFYCGVLIFFVQGHDWARYVVLAGSVLALTNAVSSFAVPSKFIKAYLVLDTLFSAFVIFYLTRPHVVEYFLQSRR